MAVPVNRQCCQYQCHGTKYQHRRSAIGDITDLFGKAYDLDVEICIFKLLPNLRFYDFVIGNIINLIAILVDLGQFSGDHRTGLIARDQGADKTALTGRTLNTRNHFRIEMFGRHCAGNDRIRTETVLGNFVDVTVWRPQGLHAEAINAWQKNHCLGHII